MKLTIKIWKDEVLYDIDASTYKRMESTLSGEPERVQNALSSDSKDELDKNLLHRYMETRDAIIRRKLTFCIVKNEVQELNVSNRLKISETSFDYELNAPEGFDGTSAQILASLMHKYIVDGCIYDWYSYQHMDCHITQGQLEDMESQISNMLRKSYVSRPLQPFGPAK